MNNQCRGRRYLPRLKMRQITQSRGLILLDIMRRPNSIIVLIIHFLNNLQKKTLSKSLQKFENSATRARGLETWQPLNSISVADVGLL